MISIPVEHKRRKKKCVRGRRPKGKQHCCNGTRKGSRKGHKRGICKK